MARNFDGPPTRDEIPILRGQIFTEQQVAHAIYQTACVMEQRRDDTSVVVISVNEGARFFSDGIRRAGRVTSPGFQPPVYEIKITRTDSDSSFRDPAVAEGLPDDLDLSQVKAWVEEDIVDEGRTIVEAILPLLTSHGAKEENISIWSLLARSREFVKRDPELDRMTHAALIIDSDGFVFGSNIDDARLRKYPRYAHDAGRGEAGIWENDPIKPNNE